jgi:polar amino acid transport system substrate-binding protein
MMMRNLTTLAAIALAATTLTSCGGGDDGANETAWGLDLVQDGTLSVCSDVPYKPFEDFDKSAPSGFSGFDIDLMSDIAKGLDLKLAVKDSGFDGIQSGAALAAGQCDIAASAMTITDAREKNLDFSEPYYDSQQSLLVPSGSDIAGIDDLAGKKVGVQQGTTGADYAKEHVPDGTDLISFPSDAELYPAIQSGNVDAVLQDLPVNLGHTQDGKFEIVEKYDTDEHYGFAVKEEGNEELLKEVNAQLQKLRDDGTYDKLYEKYFSTE